MSFSLTCYALCFFTACSFMNSIGWFVLMSLRGYLRGRKKLLRDSLKHQQDFNTPRRFPTHSFFSTAFQHISMYKSFLFLSSSHALKAQACKYLSSHKHLRKAEKIHQSDDEIYFMALWSLKVILPSSSSTSTVSSSAFELNVINLVAMCFMRVLWMYNHDSWQSASSLLRERY